MSPRAWLPLLLLAACSGGADPKDDPAVETDVVDTPSEDTVGDTPVDDTVDDTPVDDTVDDTPVDDTVEDTPVDTTPVDLDSDGVLSDVDCDDGNAARFPGNPEVCDGLDNDCLDGLADSELDLTGDGLPECAAASCPATGMTWTPSAPDPTYGTVYVSCAGCEPYNGDTTCETPLPVMCVADTRLNDPNPGGSPQWFPGPSQITEPIAGCQLSTATAGDALCEGRFGPGYRMASFHDAGGFGATYLGAWTTPDHVWVSIDDQPGNCWNLDLDGDGVKPPYDCDDQDAGRFRDNVEVVGDGVDQDCDGGELCPWDRDGDGFGYGVLWSADVTCGNAANEGTQEGDCLDVGAGAATIFPDAAELCDGLDNDCDGQTPDGEVDLTGDGLLDCAVGSCSNSGMTFDQTHVDAAAGVVRWSCHGDFECSPGGGDSNCINPLPLLCVHPIPSTPNPGTLAPWFSGEVEATPPVTGCQLTSLSTADDLCAARFGAGWRMAEFHDAGGWSIVGLGDQTEPARAWVYLNDGPAACWQ